MNTEPPSFYFGAASKHRLGRKRTNDGKVLREFLLIAGGANLGRGFFTEGNNGERRNRFFAADKKESNAAPIVRKWT
jgi:hypothetical protein